MVDVSEERQRRFFIKTDRGYQIRKFIRDQCVFARQNVTKDPPFSHLDLICCRNLLIYFGPILQKHLMPIFHYALKPDGYLILGSAESLGTFTDLFRVVDKRHKIFIRKMTSGQAFSAVSLNTDPSRQITPSHSDEIRLPTATFDIQREMDRLLLNKYVPAGVLINEDGDILSFRGNTGPYLQPASGQASLNIFKMIHESLQLEIRAALKAAIKQYATIRKSRLKARLNGHDQPVHLEIVPLRLPRLLKERYFLVIFREDVFLPAGRAAKGKRHDTRQVAQLRQELAFAKDYLQTVIEEQNATNEELETAKEEPAIGQ